MSGTTPHTPIYAIYKDGVDITGNFSDRATMISVEMANGGSSDILRITLDDRDWRIATPHSGDILRVSLGYQEVGLAEMGSFEIDEVTFTWPPKGLTITGTSTGTRGAQKAPTVRNYDGLTLGGILRDIAKSFGAEAMISPELDSIQVPYRNSISSPMHLLTELQTLYGAVAKVGDGGNGKVLSFTARDTGRTASGQTTSLVILQPHDIAALSIKNSSRTSHSKVRASWFDKDSLTRQWVETLNPLTGRSDFPPFNMGRLFGSKVEAEAAAKSQMGTLVRGENTGTVVLSRGDPFIRDQSRVLIEGWRDGVTGGYVSDTVTHEFTKAAGIVTTLQVTSSGLDLDYSAEAGAQGPQALPGDTLLPPSKVDPATGRIIGPV